MQSSDGCTIDFLIKASMETINKPITRTDTQQHITFKLMQFWQIFTHKNKHYNDVRIANITTYIQSLEMYIWHFVCITLHTCEESQEKMRTYAYAKAAESATRNRTNEEYCSLCIQSIIINYESKRLIKLTSSKTFTMRKPTHHLMPTFQQADSPLRRSNVIPKILNTVQHKSLPFSYRSNCPAYYFNITKKQRINLKLHS